MLRTAVGLAALTLALAGCGSTRLTDVQYQEICLAYAKGHHVTGDGARFALEYAIEYMHLDRQAAADAYEVARREYCP